jgi:hypothetical protein
MADLMRTAQYFKVQVVDKPGEMARLLRVLQELNVSVRTVHGFLRHRRTQVDFLSADPTIFSRMCASAGRGSKRNVGGTMP